MTEQQADTLIDKIEALTESINNLIEVIYSEAQHAETKPINSEREHIEDER